MFYFVRSHLIHVLTNRSLGVAEPSRDPWSDKYDPTDWILWKDVFGINVVWDGIGNFYDRKSGVVVKIPKSLKLSLPNFPIEGVVYNERDPLDIESIWRHLKDDENLTWEFLSISLFDLPGHSFTPLESRMKILSSLKSNLPTGKISILEHYVCQSRSHLQDLLETIGEHGIVLKRSNSMYIQNRCSYILKVS